MHDRDGRRPLLVAFASRRSGARATRLGQSSARRWRSARIATRMRWSCVFVVGGDGGAPVTRGAGPASTAVVTPRGRRHDPDVQRHLIASPALNAVLARSGTLIAKFRRETPSGGRQDSSSIGSGCDALSLWFKTASRHGASADGASGRAAADRAGAGWRRGARLGAYRRHPRAARAHGIPIDVIAGTSIGAVVGRLRRRRQARRAGGLRARPQPAPRASSLMDHVLRAAPGSSPAPG